MEENGLRPEAERDCPTRAIMSNTRAAEATLIETGKKVRRQRTLVVPTIAVCDPLWGSNRVSQPVSQPVNVVNANDEQANG